MLIPTLAFAAFLAPTPSACDGNHTIKTASDVHRIYTCRRLGGNLTIDGAIARVNLPRLREIDGSLFVKSDRTSTLSAQHLTRVGKNLSLFGKGLRTVNLQRLETIGDGLNVQHTLLENLDGLAAVKTVEGVSIAHTPKLMKVELPNLETVGFSFWVANNAAVTLVRMPKLARVQRLFLGQNAELAQAEFPMLDSGSLDVAAVDNPKLRSLAAPRLPSLRGDLRLADLPALRKLDLGKLRKVSSLDLRTVGLRNLQGLAGLEVVDKRINIFASPGLRHAVLPSLRSVGESVYVHSNRKLVTSRFPVLQTVAKEVRISNNPMQTHLGAPKLRSVPATLTVQHLPKLSALTLPALREVGFASFIAIGVTDFKHVGLKRVTVANIYDNARLIDGGLPRLERVVSRLRYSRNAKLQRVSLPKLRAVGQKARSGSLTFDRSDALEHVGLPQLRVVHGSLGAELNPRMRTFDAERLTKAKALSVQDVPKLERLHTPALVEVHILRVRRTGLTNLDGQAKLATAKELVVRDNVSLNRLTLPDLTLTGSRFEVVDNDNLPRCWATRLRDQLLKRGYTGTPQISGNQSGGTCTQDG